MLVRTVLFLLLNFGALAIGGLFTGQGVPSDWYAELNKAPWTPPGWVFGFAWTAIMLCFSVYMAQLWPKVENRNRLLLLFSVQWVLNVSWNPVFFSLHQTALGLVIITGLTVLMGYFLLHYRSLQKAWSLLVLPYVLWLMIATSLNGYIVLFN